MWGMTWSCSYIYGNFSIFLSFPNHSHPSLSLTMARFTATSTSKPYKPHAVSSMTKVDLIKLCDAKDKRYKELRKMTSK